MHTAVQIDACIQARDARDVDDPEKLERKRAIARRIVDARKGVNLNPNQFAKRCGTTWQHVQRWEDVDGKPTTPEADHLVRIAEVTGRTVDWLLGKSDDATIERPAAYPALADFLTSIEGRTVTPAERKQLEGQRWKNQPTPHSYYLLLLAIRSGTSPADAAAEAEVTGEALGRAVARGGRPLRKAPK